MFLNIILLFVGITLLVLGAEYMVRGASRVAASFDIDPLVIGLTVVAFGTSAPELCVSVIAALEGTADVAVGNVVGSNICNILLIIGAAALFGSVSIPSAVVKRELPIMIAVMGVFYFFASSGEVSRVEGVALTVGILLYVAVSYYLALRDPSVSEFADEEILQPESRNLKRDGLFVVGGILGMVFGADLIVDSAVAIARAFSVSDLIIAITLVAVGTSLPELATTVVASKRGQAELAVGNAIGSNIFNVLCVIGVTSTIAPLPVSSEALSNDFPFMLLTSVVLLPLVMKRNPLKKGDGIGMLVVYALYVGYLVIR